MKKDRPWVWVAKFATKSPDAREAGMRTGSQVILVDLDGEKDLRDHNISDQEDFTVVFLDDLEQTQYTAYRHELSQWARRVAPAHFVRDTSADQEVTVQYTVPVTPAYRERRIAELQAQVDRNADELAELKAQPVLEDTYEVGTVIRAKMAASGATPQHYRTFVKEADGKWSEGIGKSAHFSWEQVVSYLLGTASRARPTVGEISVSKKKWTPIWKAESNG